MDEKEEMRREKNRREEQERGGTSPNSSPNMTTASTSMGRACATGSVRGLLGSTQASGLESRPPSMSSRSRALAVHLERKPSERVRRPPARQRRGVTNGSGLRLAARYKPAAILLQFACVFVSPSVPPACQGGGLPP